jgi:choline dehydrogenase-like flavoprotein
MKSAADWDAVIVGAGAGGAAAAYGLCKRGLSVLLLEAGPRFDPINDYPLTGSDWELRDFPKKAGSTGSVTFAPGQKLTRTEPLLVSRSRGMGPVVTSDARWMDKYYHVRGVGGTLFFRRFIAQPHCGKVEALSTWTVRLRFWPGATHEISSDRQHHLDRGHIFLCSVDGPP